MITELPYQVNHDNFITSIAEQVRDGKLGGIANIEDQGSDRVGIRIVVELKRDAVAKVVLNNLYKHTQLQTSFGANMLVDRRRGAAHAAAGSDDPATTSTTNSTSSSGAPPIGCARPTSAPTSCAAWSKRWTRWTR